jgi:hypothetical protein
MSFMITIVRHVDLRPLITLANIFMEILSPISKYWKHEGTLNKETDSHNFDRAFYLLLVNRFLARSFSNP